MRDYTHRALNQAQAKGATYADIRIVRRETQTLEVKNGVVQTLSLGDTYGFGIRVVADGAWGFASSHRLESGEIDRVASLAVAIAKAS
ncbi:MAG: DNA gyrase modulator, partial [Candidatus Bipolaricaulis sp.]|nr:DNA gyrase modulator [Candidatus Bipolaricaulis sp.]